MKKLLHNSSFLIMISFSNIALSQNLVPNPSFEILDSCPDGSSQIDRATGWFPFTSSPDLIHPCLSPPSTGCAKTGKAKAWIGCYRDPMEYNEILGAELISPLIVGKKYYVSFRIRLQKWSVDVGINKLGAKFTMQKYCYSLNDITNMCDSTPLPITNWAHIVSNKIITDTSSWTTIFGSFIADSAYKYIAIGHFFDQASTDTIMLDSWISVFPFYEIDDVCVSEDSTTCLDITPEIINFQADSTQIEKGSCVLFTINTVVDYDWYQWYFPGGTPEVVIDSTGSISTLICYDTTGVFDVSLIAGTNEGCMDTITLQNYMMVTAPAYLSEQHKTPYIVVYPNPAKETVYIGSSENSILQVRLFDVIGNLLISQTGNSINIRNLVAGFYLVEVATNNTTYRTKLLVTSKP